MSIDSVDAEGACNDLLAGYTPAEQESISVLVRVRPFLDNDYEVDDFDEAEGEPESVVNITSRTDMTVLSMDEKRKFNCSYDSILGPEVSQDDIYQEIRKCTTSVVHGFNSTIFAYGQTGAGKTFTIQGPILDVDAFNMSEHEQMTLAQARASKAVKDNEGII